MKTQRDWRGLAADIRAAATPRGRAALGRFSIEGTRLHERALRAGATVERVLVGRSLRAAPAEREARLVAELERAGAELLVAPDEELAKLTDGRGIGAMLGLVPLPEPRSVAQVIGSAPVEPGRPARLLVAVRVKEPGNLGALVRSAHALGAVALATVDSSDVFHPKAARTSMGSLFRLPVIPYAELAPLAADLAALGVRSYGAVTGVGTPLNAADFDQPAVALVLGSEAFGLSEAELSRLDGAVTIPMAEDVDSLSVNAAAAVLLYAAGRGRVTNSP